MHKIVHNQIHISLQLKSIECYRLHQNFAPPPVNRPSLDPHATRDLATNSQLVFVQGTAIRDLTKAAAAVDLCAIDRELAKLRHELAPSPCWIWRGRHSCAWQPRPHQAGVAVPRVCLRGDDDACLHRGRWPPHRCLLYQHPCYHHLMPSGGGRLLLPRWRRLVLPSPAPTPSSPSHCRARRSGLRRQLRAAAIARQELKSLLVPSSDLHLAAYRRRSADAFSTWVSSPPPLFSWPFVFSKWISPRPLPLLSCWPLVTHWLGLISFSCSALLCWTTAHTFPPPCSALPLKFGQALSRGWVFCKCM